MPSTARLFGIAFALVALLAPGAASFVVLPALKPGTYRFFDEFHPETPDMRVIAR